VVAHDFSLEPEGASTSPRQDVVRRQLFTARRLVRD
jgi:hypothetical protein